MKARPLILIAFAVAALAAPTAGTALSPVPIRVCADTPVVVGDELTDATAADPAPVAESEDAAATAADLLGTRGCPSDDLALAPVDRRIGLDQRPTPILVSFISRGWLQFEALTVFSSGEANVRFFDRAGSFTLSRSELAQLRSALEQAHFRSLRARYAPTKPWVPECPSSSVSYAGRTVEIFCYRGQLPQALVNLTGVLSRLLRSHRPADAGTAPTSPIDPEPSDVSPTEATVAVLDEPTDATSADPAPVEPAPAVEPAATSDDPLFDFDTIEMDPRLIAPLVTFRASGFLVSARLIVWQSGEANAYFNSRGRLRIGMFALSRSKLAQLRSALEQAHFRSLRSLYTPTHRPKDCGPTTVTYAGRTVTIDCYPEQVPGPLVRLTSLLSRMLYSHSPDRVG